VIALLLLLLLVLLAGVLMGAVGWWIALPRAGEGPRSRERALLGWAMAALGCGGALLAGLALLALALLFAV
jgi:hypothetical protein